ncbi:uncharacterized protein LOC127860864 [Dreissena polymorpha]|uniref:Uncharacterized protein n=1 Tax=Dreissena polymorpha TaxID=45954 RepID=A0A9D4BKE2_DREPO|nr:uncharacterized protein LOC127860864 [Dreissena polymorpha]KAH3699214.1 hypothetical protein DPMN_074169 [Dreissena polymorpha]
MASDNSHRHEGGPLERSHMKEMILRNALESAALIKTSKHLESQRRAFVRQSTRDEDEMRSLLGRLQMGQPLVTNGDAVSDSAHYTCTESVNGMDETDGYMDRVISSTTSEINGVPFHSCQEVASSNPYPVTILPRFGGTPSRKLPVVSTRVPIWSRRKSIEYEDIQDSLTSMRSSATSSVISTNQRVSGSTSCLLRESARSGDWLASPEAISSVRRMRKSVTSQAQRKLLRKPSTDSQYSNESLTGSGTSSPLSRSRNNSLKERKRHDSVHDGEISPRNTRSSRHGGSLKERKKSQTDTGNIKIRKPIARSYSTLSKSPGYGDGFGFDRVSEILSTDIARDRPVDKYSDSETTRNKSLKRAGACNKGHRAVCRVSSNESNISNDSDVVNSPE